MKKKITLAAAALTLMLGSLLSAAASVPTGSSDPELSGSISSSLSSVASSPAASGFDLLQNAPTIMIGIGVALMVIAAIVSMRKKKL